MSNATDTITTWARQEVAAHILALTEDQAYDIRDGVASADVLNLLHGFRHQLLIDDPRTVALRTAYQDLIDEGLIEEVGRYGATPGVARATDAEVVPFLRDLGMPCVTSPRLCEIAGVAPIGQR